MRKEGPSADAGLLAACVPGELCLCGNDRLEEQINGLRKYNKIKSIVKTSKCKCLDATFPFPSPVC